MTNTQVATIPDMPVDLSSMSVDDIITGLMGSADDAGGTLVKYMKFTGREGRYLVPNGTEDPDELPKNTKMGFAIFASSKAWVCWKNDEVIDATQPVGLLARAPDERDLAEHGPFQGKRDGWSLQFTLVLRSLEDDGQLYVLKVASVSARRAVAQLLEDIIAAVRADGKDIRTQVPVITLGVESFRSQDFKNYKPVFKITSWESSEHYPTELVGASQKVSGDDNGSPVSGLIQASVEDVTPIEVEAPRAGRAARRA